MLQFSLNVLIHLSHEFSLPNPPQILKKKCKVCICGNKMPTRCNIWFYGRSYCLLNMFQAPLCPSSGAREYYTGGCCLWCLVLWFSSCRYGVELRVMCPVCGLLLYNTLELLTMDTMVPETCWASNKICNKKHLLHLVGNLFPHINDDAGQNHFKFTWYVVSKLLVMGDFSPVYSRLEFLWLGCTGGIPWMKVLILLLGKYTASSRVTLHVCTAFTT